MLTEKRIERLVPPPHVSELNVRDEPGLVLRVRRNQDGSVSRSWAFWRVRGGKKERAKIGTWPQIDLAEARRQADHYRKLAETGVRVSADLAPAAEAGKVTTVGELFDLWLKLYAEPRHKDGGKRVRWLLERHAAIIRTVPLAALTKQHITLTVLPLVNARHAKTAGDLFTLLKQITAFAARHDFLTSDPAGALRRSDLVPPRNAPKERALSEDELRALAEACTRRKRCGAKGREFELAEVPPTVAAALWAQLATACRPGELAAARWTEVDLKAGVWRIPAANAKTGKPHTVALSPFARDALGLLKELAAGAPEVLPMGRPALGRMVKDRQRAEKDRSPTKRAHSAALALPGGPWSLHDLRRSSATLLASEGIPPHVIERCLAHSPPKLVRTYQRADLADEQREAFLVLGRKLSKLAPKLFATLRKDLEL